MNDLEFYSNIYADLPQGAYVMRPRFKMFAELDYKQTKEIMGKIMRLLRSPMLKISTAMMQVRTISK